MRTEFQRFAFCAVSIAALQLLCIAEAPAATHLTFAAVPIGAAFQMGLASEAKAPLIVQQETQRRPIGNKVGATLARIERATAMRMGIFSTVDHSLNVWLGSSHNSRSYLGFGVRW